MKRAELPVWAVVPATGVGSRMQADRPKQYLQLGNTTILELTLDRLLRHPAVEGVVVVLNEADQYWPSLDYTPSKQLLTCSGGAERFHSVFNGLNTLAAHLGGDALVLIHDAVRPFVTLADLGRVIAAAREEDDGAILAAALADTLKLANAEQAIQETSPRDRLWRAFTPQAFRLELIQNALDRVIRDKLEVTDDASAMEQLGYHPRLVAGDQRNFKITRREDLALAELLLNSLANE